MDASANSDADAPKPSASPAPVGEPEGVRSTATSTPNGMRSSPPALLHDVAPDLDEAPDDTGVKSDSEAETIVLPGKDGHSPSKIRKSIKHEDKSEADEAMDDLPREGSRKRDEVSYGVGKKMGLMDGGSEPEAEATTSSNLGKRKRPKAGNNSTTDDLSHHKGHSNQDHDSSSLSNPSPSSPVAAARPSILGPATSDSSDVSRSPSPRTSTRGKAKSVDRILSRHKQFASGDEGDLRGFKRQRSSGVEQKQSRDRLSIKHEDSSRKRTRSVSPPTRGHRRSISTQLPSKSSHGLSHKKKRMPAPLRTTEYHSDDSSSSDNSHPGSSRLRHIAAPAPGDSAISPAKMAPHKKHVNSSGQTLVARACASGKLEIVKQRLEERPDDLNEGDHAQNTPLHTASIAGHVDIVKFLLSAGCAVDPVNVARDTPLHDAIDNGHLDVVILLLEAGANPRKANGKGEDPYDLVEEDTDVTDELREAIMAAKQKTSDRRSSEDDQIQDADGRPSHSKGSPRQTSPAQFQETRETSHTSRRNPSTRSIKTSDRVLYQPLNLSELRRAAAQNDINTVVRILDVHSSSLDDPRSLIIAAKAGHPDVINMLFGYGEFNPDPDPLDNQPPDSATPILAAIGRENLEVIKLFLNQPDFDPTRRIKGETYFEIAKRRGGSVWKEEEVLLKDAFDKHKKAHKVSPSKPRSPGLRRDGRETDSKRPSRREEPQLPRSHKRRTSSPKLKDSEASKSGPRGQIKEGHSGVKRGPGRPRKEEAATANSDRENRENSPLGPPKQKSQKRSESELVASESETAIKPRRKLVSGKEFRGDRDLGKPRRTSVTSITSSASTKDRRDGESKPDKAARKTSPSVSRISKTSSPREKDSPSEKPSLDLEKPRSLKRDDSKDRLSAIRGESPAKRPRKSETPPRSGMQEVTTNYDTSGGPQKRRKIEGDSRPGNKTEIPVGSSSDHRTPSHSKIASNEKTTKLDPETNIKEKPVRAQKRVDSPERSRHLRQEEDKRQERVAKEASTVDSAASVLKIEEELESRKRREKQQAESQARREKEELEAKEEAEREEKLAEYNMNVRLAREQLAREEEARRQQEENERKERQRQEDAEAHSREQERQKKLYLEQEKQKREDQERRRAQIQEQQRAERIRVEKEKRMERLAKLPLLLRWLDMSSDPRTLATASLFRFIGGFRYDTIRPEATGLPNGREQWMLNTHVALLLGEKDLQLSRYTAWERIPLSRLAKEAVWKIENGIYSLQHPNLTALYQQFPKTEEDGLKVVEQCKALFLELDLFFVKVSEFMFVVPNFPHLRSLELVINYRELLEVPTWPPQIGKWSRDPDVDPTQRFAPQPTYYVNGDFVRQVEVLRNKISSVSLGERRVPRKWGLGLQQVFPHEPEYSTLAKEQGLTSLLPEYDQQAFQDNQQMNGAQPLVNGITPPSSDKSKSINGGSPPKPNGILAHADIATITEDAATEEVTDT